MNWTAAAADQTDTEHSTVQIDQVGDTTTSW